MRRVAADWLPRDAGAAVLLISDDLDEVMALGDRIAVMSRGGALTHCRAEGSLPIGAMVGRSMPTDRPREKVPRIERLIAAISVASPRRVAAPHVAMRWKAHQDIRRRHDSGGARYRSLLVLALFVLASPVGKIPSIFRRGDSGSVFAGERQPARRR